MSFFRKIPPPDLRTILSGVLVTLSAAPWDLRYLVWVSLIPWFFVLVEKKNWKEAFAEGIWLSFFFNLGTFYWVAYVLHQFGGVPWLLAIPGFLIFALLSQPQYFIVGPLFNIFRNAPPLFVLFVFSFLYAGVDWVLPKLFVDTLGDTQYLSPWLRQSVDLGGAHLLTFLIVFVNLALFACLRRYREGWRAALFSSRMELSVALGLVVAFLAYGYFRSEQIEKILAEPHPKIQMAVIQGNIGDFDKIAAEQRVRNARITVLNTFFELSNQAMLLEPRPEALVWPETSYPTTFRNARSSSEYELDRKLEGFASLHGVPLLFGGYDYQKGLDYNAFFFLTPRPGQLGDLQVYRKNILLMFGEYIPGADLIPWIKRNFPQVGFFGRGSGPEVLTVYGKTVSALAAPVICYEALFPNYVIGGVRKGAHMILNITNDSWFGPRGEPQLHLALSALRSIETRRPQLRSTNTGISALILPTGEIAQRTGIYTAEVMNAAVPILPPIWTLMLAWGDWFGGVAFALGMLGLLVLRGRARG